MEATPVDVDVHPGEQATVDLELKIAAVRESVTVSAQADGVDTTETSSKVVLQESTVANTPNANERIESLLPLIPGVVRGPDGLINMKGAPHRRVECLSIARTSLIPSLAIQV